MHDFSACRVMLERQSWRLEEAVQEQLGLGDIVPPRPSGQQQQSSSSVFSGGEEPAAHGPGPFPRFRFGAQPPPGPGPRFAGHHVSESFGGGVRHPRSYPNNLGRGDGPERGDNGGGFSPLRLVT